MSTGAGVLALSFAFQQCGILLAGAGQKAESWGKLMRNDSAMRQENGTDMTAHFSPLSFFRALLLL